MDHSLAQQSQSAYNGILRTRFVGEVDEHFLCRFCHHVAKNPRECKACQDLMCAKCVKDVSTCTCGVTPLVLKDMARYARMVYETLQLTCGNASTGCEFVGSIGQVLEHQPGCLYKVSKCSSVVCPNSIAKIQSASKRFHVCSRSCKVIIKFQRGLESGGAWAPEKFRGYMDKLYAALESEIMDQVNGSREQSPQELLAEELTQERAGLLEEINYRKTHYHPGKMSKKNQLWSCCGLEDKFAPGCREIA